MLLRRLGFCALAGVLGLGMAPVAIAQDALRCSGEAPSEYTCTVVVELDRPILSAVIFNTMPAGGLIVEVKTDAGYMKRALCASALPYSHCEKLISGPTPRVGDTITIEALAIGRGSWWINLLEPDKYPCPEKLYGCED